MANCAGARGGGLELTLVKINDFEAPIWIYSKLILRELDSGRPRYLTLSSSDVTELVGGLLRIAKKQSRSEPFESSDGDFKLEARESQGAVELVVSLGEPHQATNPSCFACSFDDVAAFAGSLRAEQLNLLEKTRSS